MEATHERPDLSHRFDRRDHVHPFLPRAALTAGPKGKRKDMAMTPIETRAEPVSDGTVLQIQWTPIVAGGIAAAALALVLHSFAVAIGLSVSSTAPTWRDASIALV